MGGARKERRSCEERKEFRKTLKARLQVENSRGWKKAIRLEPSEWEEKTLGTQAGPRALRLWATFELLLSVLKSHKSLWRVLITDIMEVNFQLNEHSACDMEKLSSGQSECEEIDHSVFCKERGSLLNKLCLKDVLKKNHLHWKEQSQEAKRNSKPLVPLSLKGQRAWEFIRAW